MRIKWTKPMLKARIKMLELEIAEWKQHSEFQQSQLIFAQATAKYAQSAEFEKVRFKDLDTRTQASLNEIEELLDKSNRKERQ